MFNSKHNNRPPKRALPLLYINKHFSTALPPSKFPPFHHFSTPLSTAKAPIDKSKAKPTLLRISEIPPSPNYFGFPKPFTNQAFSSPNLPTFLPIIKGPKSKTTIQSSPSKTLRLSIPNAPPGVLLTTKDRSIDTKV